MADSGGLALFHVSTDGRDAWSGRHGEPLGDGTDGPFATVERARDAVRGLKAAGELPSGEIVVEIRGGIHALADTLHFGAEDSGAAEAPITYRARHGERVRLMGGRRLDPAAFEPVTDPGVRLRLCESARECVVQIDLRKQGIVDFGDFASRGFGRKTTAAHLELFFNDEPQTVARWPNTGEFLTIRGFTKPMIDEWGREQGELTGGFLYDGDRPRQWAPRDDIHVHGYWAYDWADSYERVNHLDGERRVVETAAPHGNYFFGKGQRFYFFNVLEELDEPGEYYVDRLSGLLYLWPPSELASAEVLVTAGSEPLLAVADARHLRFEGLIVEGSRGNGVTITGGDAVWLTGCTIRNHGNWAVRIREGINHRVAGCTIYGTGDGGISVQGGDRATLRSCGNAIVGNHIHHYSRWSRCYCAAITAHGVGMHLAHNLIHDAPHNAILFTGNDLLIEKNEIYRVCMETGDVGAIYTGRDYTFRGNVIRQNFIHHLGGMGMGSIAIYMDDCVSGSRITENVMWKCQYGILLGGGRDFEVTNNVFVECNPAISADARGTDTRAVWRNMVTVTMKERLEAMAPHEPPYSERYPEIADVVPYFAGGEGVPPENNLVARNICWRCPTWIHEPWPAGADNGITEQDNLVNTDPGFVDEEGGDFRLIGDSPAWKVGFLPIPLNEIGLRGTTLSAGVE